MNYTGDNSYDWGVDAERKRLTTWRPIETAPMDGTHILAYDPEWTDHPGIAVLQWSHTEWENAYSEVETDWDWAPTHWLPLPIPPE